LASADDLGIWWARHTGGVVLLTLGHDDDTWIALARARDDARNYVVAVLDPPSVALAASALRAGAGHFVARGGDPADFRRVVDEIMGGNLTLPYEVLRAATAAPRPGRRVVEPSDEEVGWLRSLSAGASVATLAISAQYSERMMYRKLRDLYVRLGVARRTQAIIVARDEGWL
jgi:DNA-binding NarL/FixJ family response regulator